MCFFHSFIERFFLNKTALQNSIFRYNQILVMTSDFIIGAPCKINVHLRILGKRDDGFHDLESIFMALDFGDTLSFTVLDTENACVIKMDGRVPREQNLIFKAVSLFREYTGFSASVLIDVQKMIPFGSGLGGASSDAASTLKALNVLGNYRLDNDELHHLALQLGSDVPFFLNSGTAFVSGRGEKIDPVKTPDTIWIVLANPGFSSATAEAYRLFDEHGIPDAGPELSKRQLIDALAADPSEWPYKNDFLPVFLSCGKKDEKEAYQNIFRAFEASGALFSGLSGAGSTCFGVYKDRKSAEKAVHGFHFAGSFVKLTYPLAR